MNVQKIGFGLVGAMLGGSLTVASAAPLQTIATDPYTQATCAASGATNHRANAEPDSFAYGSTIVAAYQVGRIYDGGACAAGFSTSTDNGAHWTTGLLPGITKRTGGSTYDRVTDAAVAYDVKHGVWLVSTLGLVELPGDLRGAAVLTSRSKDGKKWESTPIVTDQSSIDLDKNWIVCDNSPASPYYGNCYTQWDDYGAGNKLYMSTSTDGGLTWGPPRTNNAGVIGGQPVVRPDGTVVVPIANANETAIGAFYSNNGGASWSALKTIATIKHHTVAGALREGPLPSAEVDGSGVVYIAWTDCRFRQACKANDIVFVKSTDPLGTAWSAVTRVPIDATSSGIDHFIPGLAVNPATSGASAQIGLTYYYYAAKSSSLNVGFISSQTGGSTWSTAVKEPVTAAPSTWAATTSQGRMVGDYISSSFGSDGLAHGIVVVAKAPSTGSTTGCTTSGLDNCDQSVATFAEPVGSAALLAATGPVLFTGTGGSKAQSFWNIVDNNGAKHRD